MRRPRTTTLLRAFLAAMLALAGAGPRGSYAHTHASADGAPHARPGHDDGPGHDHHDGPHDEGPTLGEGVAHVHGTWLGLTITLPVPDGGEDPPVVLDGDSWPATLSAAKAGPFGPARERIPWAPGLAPPGAGPNGIGRPIARDLPRDGAGPPRASNERTVVLRC